MEKQSFQVLPFEAVKEDWSLYRLRDKSIAKVRYILINVIKSIQLDVFGNPTFSFNYATVVGIIPEESLLGSPSPSISPEILNASIVEKDIDFETMAEPWNEYRTEGKILRIKLVLTRIARTNVFDEHGIPIYLVNTQPIIKMEQ